MHAMIIGAAGYTGGELIRILSVHPQIKKITAVSSSQQGKKVHEVHNDLFHLELFFAAEPVPADVIFLAVGHGEAVEWMKKFSSSSSVIIDLSRDHRLNTGKDFVYGLSEWNKHELQSAKRIANPGCFATAIQLALLPLVQNDFSLKGLSIIALTGSTGAGYKPSATTHFSHRVNNISTYKVFEHEHNAEINRSVEKVSNEKGPEVSFVPVRGDFSRGIFSLLQFESDREEEELLNLFEARYAQDPFVHVKAGSIELKQVINTNHSLIGVEKKKNKVLITCVIDNLLKGASGQAVQNMNLALGFAEDSGLQLKNSAY